MSKMLSFLASRRLFTSAMRPAPVFRLGATAGRAGLLGASRANFKVGEPVTILSPLPPPEFEADGLPRKYPLNQQINVHPYRWEKWGLDRLGVFHTVYIGERGGDYDPQMAWLGSKKVWFAVAYWMITGSTVILLWRFAGTFGIKPLRYTIEWMEAAKERERQENANPVTRYLDRRCAERGFLFHMSEISLCLYNVCVIEC